MNISVIMAVYNGDALQLECAVSSVLAQTMEDFEFIICDDGSEEKIARQLLDYPKKDGRVRLFRNEENRGLAYSLNRCIETARGELLVRQDGDDASVPERLAELCAFAEEHPEYDIISSNLTLVDDTGPWGTMRYPAEPKAEDFLFCVPFMHGAVAMRRTAVLAAGGYRVAKETRRTEDIDLFMRMYANGSRGYTLSKELYLYREDKNAGKKRKYRYRIDEARVKWKGFRRLGLLPKGIPYVVKPLVVGCIPRCLLERMKDRHYHRKE